MAYQQNLGRVKGEKGAIYYPIVTQSEENNNAYTISWEKRDFEDEEPDPITIMPQVYIPTVENGILSFTLGSPTSETLSSFNIKGDKGDAGSMNIEYVTSEPESGEPDTMYIDIVNNNTYVFNGNVRYEIDNLIELEDYYRKNETYGKYQSTSNKTETTYSAQELDSKIGAIESVQLQIMNLLG